MVGRARAGEEEKRHTCFELTRSMRESYCVGPMKKLGRIWSMYVLSDSWQVANWPMGSKEIEETLAM